MQASSSCCTVPSSSLYMAPVGQFATQAGLSQWLQERFRWNMATSGYVPHSKVSTRRRRGPATWMSRRSLQATWQVLQPMQLARST